MVGWEGYEWGARYKDDLTMRDFLDAHCKNGSKRNNSMVPPFHFPGTSPSGPDVVFVLRIEEQLYPVFVQNKFLNVSIWRKLGLQYMRQGSRLIYRTWPRTALMEST